MEFPGGLRALCCFREHPSLIMHHARNRRLANLIPSRQRLDADAANAMRPSDRVRHFVTQLRVTLAFPSAWTMAALLDHVESIVPPTACEQVCFVHARRIVAVMEGALSLRECPVDVLENKSVRLYPSAPKVKLSISKLPTTKFAGPNMT